MTVSIPNVIEIKLDRLIEDMRFLRSHMIAFDKRLNGIEAYLKPSEPSEQQPNDDFDVLADGTVVGRIYEATQSACSNSSSVIAIVPYKLKPHSFLVHDGDGTSGCRTSLASGNLSDSNRM